MKITTPQGILEGDNIEAILKEHGFHCLYGADLSGADLRGADLSGADLHDAYLHDANLRYANLRYANLNCACLGVLPFPRNPQGWHAIRLSANPEADTQGIGAYPPAVVRTKFRASA